MQQDCLTERANDVDATPVSTRITWFSLPKDLRLASPSRDALLTTI